MSVQTGTWDSPQAHVIPTKMNEILACCYLSLHSDMDLKLQE